MSSPLDEQGLDLFEETASAAGNFPHALRGYDRATVDAYVREVEAKFARVVSELRETQYRLGAAQAAADTTDYSRLGGHARGLLKSAEAQAAEIIQAAQAEAEVIRSRAGLDRTRTLNETSLALDATRAAGVADVEQIRQLLGAQTAAELEAARADITALRDATLRQRDWLLREGETRARAIIDAALAEAEQRKAEVERLAAEQATQLATAREAALAEIAASRQAATDQIAEVIAAAQREAEENYARLDADVLTADQRREVARAEAAEITRAATERAEAELTAARHEVERLLADANRTAEDRSRQLRHEIEALTLRKQGIIEQLEQLSSLATDSVKQHPDPAAEAPTHP